MPPKRRSLKTKVKEEEDDLVLRLSPDQQGNMQKCSQ